MARNDISASLPTELWLDIFETATQPNFRQNVAVTDDAPFFKASTLDDRDISTVCAGSMVSRRWRSLTVRQLFRHVVADRGLAGLKDALDRVYTGVERGADYVRLR